MEFKLKISLFNLAELPEIPRESLLDSPIPQGMTNYHSPNPQGMKMAGELASLIKPQVRGNNTREGRNFDFDFFFFQYRNYFFGSL